MKQTGKNDDVAYSALEKIADSTVSLVQKYDDAKWHVITFPTIVLRGCPLLEVSIDASGKRCIEKVDRSAVLWKRPTGNFPSILVDIVTEKAFDDFASTQRALIERAHETFSQCERLAELLGQS